MVEIRKLASLTGSLLARKGAARPAMRSPLQLRGHHAVLGSDGLKAARAGDLGCDDVNDDLGWNDIEGEAGAAVAHLVSADVSEPAPPVDAGSTVADLQQAISARLIEAADRTMDAVPQDVRPLADHKEAKGRRSAQACRRSALADGRRAALTLRLDGERHLRLRLACTLHNRSAQMLITDALDRLFADEPALAALADQISSPKSSTRS